MAKPANKVNHDEAENDTPHTQGKTSDGYYEQAKGSAKSTTGEVDTQPASFGIKDTYHKGAGGSAKGSGSAMHVHEGDIPGGKKSSGKKWEWD